MKKLAFISRHNPTPEQISLAQAQGFELIHVGDRDGFTAPVAEFSADFDGVVVVHAAAALRYIDANRLVGVFENGNRAPEGAHPSFVAKALHFFSARSALYEGEVAGVTQVSAPPKKNH